jgi:hypothetical protein
VLVRCDRSKKNCMKHKYGMKNITMICKIHVANIINITQITPIIVGASPEMPSSESKMRFLSGVGLGRVVTASSTRGWPRVSCDCVFHPRLSSGESWLHLPPGLGLGRVLSLSPARGWPRASRDCLSCPGMASGEL